MSGKMNKNLLGLALLTALAACGSGGQETQVTTADIARQAVTQIIAQRRAASQPAAPARSAEQRAAEALRVNPGPLIMATLESTGALQVMAMTGQNGAMRTYMTPNEQALILRGGMLIGTRGLGNDMSVAEPATEPLIRARASGQAPRVIRYYSGDGLERPLSFDCTVAPDATSPGAVVEDCRGHGASFKNIYVVQGGQITTSRQWAGPGLGYISIQTLRP